MPKTGYADIAAHFRQRMNDGELSPGDAMPSQRDVIKEFGVSVTTANRAFRMLKAEGLTEARPGVGTVVARRPNQHVTGAARIDRLERTGQSFAPGESTMAHQAGVRSCADPDIADLLEIEPHDEVVVRTRVFVKDGEPIVYATSVIHIRALADVPELLTQGQLKPFWQKTYADRTGKQVTRSPEVRGARHASPFEIAALGIKAPPTAAVPVLVLRTSFHTEDGPIEVWEDVYAPGVWQVATGETVSTAG